MGQRALALSAGAVLAVMAALYCLAWPIADDFQRAVETRDFGMAGAVWAEYAGWTCRWSAALLLAALSSLVELTRFYGLTLLALFCAVLLLVNSFLAAALELPARSPKALAVTLVFAAVWWASAPEVAELFFWRAGSAEYQLGFAAAVAVCAYATRRDLSGARPTIGMLAMLGLAALFATGLHELAALLQASLLILIAAFARLTRRRWQPAALVALAATLIGLAIVLAAPGNAVRDQAYAASRDYLPQLGRAVFEAIESIGSFLADPRLIAGSVALLALVRAGILAPSWPGRAPAWLRWLAPAVLVAALVALYALPYVALAGGIPRRAYSAVHFVLLCGWLVVVLAWSPALARLVSPRALRWSLVVLALALPLSRNVAGGVLDLAGPAERYRTAMTSRDAELRQLHAAGVTAASIPLLASAGYPRSYVFNADVRAAPDFWVNRAVASYYGLKSVRAAVAGN